MSLEASTRACAVGLLLTGCGNGTSGPADGGTDGCAPGLEAVGPACVPIFDDCGPSEISVLGGGCERVGLPEDCWPGWVPDGEDGCEPILPTAPCPDGTMEIIGQPECQPIGDCGTGKWGSVDIQPGAKFVDAVYDGTSGAPNGTSSRPYTTIQEAVNSASDGGQVVVAEGDYEEEVFINKALRLDGVCPERTTIRGQIAGQPAVWITDEGAEVEVRGFTVTGPAWGFIIERRRNVLLEGLVVRDTGYSGVQVEDEALATIRRSVLMGNNGSSLRALGADVVAEDIVVRDTWSADLGIYGGLGISVENDPGTLVSSDATVTRAVIERNRQVGLFAIESTLTAEEVVVRDTLPNDIDGLGGWGIASENAPIITVRRSLVAGSHQIGVHLQGSMAGLEEIFVRDTIPDPAGAFGRGIDVELESQATIARSLVAGNRDSGISVFASTASIEETVVRDTKAQESDDGEGFGVAANVGSDLTMTRSLVASNRTFGVFVWGSSVNLSEVLIRDTQSRQLDGHFGAGVQIEPNLDDGSPSVATVSGCVLDANRGAGLVVLGSEAVVADTLVRGTLPTDATGRDGLGIVIQMSFETGVASTAEIQRTSLEGNSSVGLAVFSSEATVADLVVSDTRVQAKDGHFGDGIQIARLSDDSPAALATLLHTVVTNSPRLGILFLSAGGSLGESRIRDNMVPVALVDGADPTIADDNEIEGDVVHGGDYEASPPLQGL